MVWENVFTFSDSGQLYDFNYSYDYRVYNGNSFEMNFTIGSTSNIVSAYSSYTLPQISGFQNIRASSAYNLVLQSQVRNTAPTQPGAFTQPTGELEIGDTRTISWGASTDAEGNFSNYVLERSTDGGAWSNVNNNLLTPTHNWPIQPSNTLKFRVKAVDSAGLESPYRESPTYTVTKPKYYWSKYNVVPTWTEPPAKGQTPAGTSFVGRDKTAFWDGKSKTFILTGGKWSGAEPIKIGQTAWLFSDSDNVFYRFTATVDKPDASSGVSVDQVQYKVSDSTLTGPKVRDTLIQSGIIAEDGAYPIDGLHTDGFWYVRGSRVNQSIAPTGAFTAPTPATVLKPSQGVAVTFTASTAPNISLYELEYRYNSGLWTTLGTNNTALTRSFTPTTDKTLTNVQFRVRAKNTSNVYSDYVYSEFFNIEHNAKPTITLTTGNNLALSENANLAISGQAVDADNGNVLTVYYQINTGNTTALATGISNGTAPLPYTKTLQFKQGALYDGTTIVFNNMVGEQTYTLKVWAEDNQGGKSDVQSRLFTVIPNRAPVLTVTAIEPASDKINNDTMTISGTVTDPENQTITVKYKINNGDLIQVYSGAGGNYTFNFKLGALKTGENLIEIQASDSYNLVTTVVKRFTKRFDAKNLLQSVARYNGVVPVAGITGVVTWFERENGDLTIVPAASLRATGQIESYTNMTLTNSGPASDVVTEDEYRIPADNPKNELNIRLQLSKTTASSEKGIKKITGALQS